MKFKHQHTGKSNAEPGKPFFSAPTRSFSVPRQEPQPPKPNTTGIPGPVLQKMETALNTDFSNVKVFPNSTKSAEIGALAYTQGHHIHFAPGQYNPGSSDGNRLLAHELAHVVQQRQGRVKPTGHINGLPINDDPALEHHADDKGANSI